MKVYVFNSPSNEGGAAIGNVAWDFLRSQYPARSDDDHMAFAISEAQRVGNIPPGADVMVLEKEDLPANWDYFNAWTPNFSGKAVEVDMEKARAIHMDKIRHVRAGEFAKEDVRFQIASDAKDAVTLDAVRQRRTFLRDLPETFSLDGYTTVSALAAAWPPGLPLP